MYLISIIVFSSPYNLKASDQDLFKQPSKYFPSLVKEEHAENCSNKRKRENEQAESFINKRKKLTITEDSALPKKVIHLIASFVDTPIAYQKLKVVSKKWNETLADEEYTIPNKPQQVIAWVLSFIEPDTKEFSTQNFFSDFIMRNRRTPDAKSSLLEAAYSYKNLEKTSHKLMTDDLRDLSPQTLQLLNDIRESSSSIVHDSAKQQLYDMLLLWQPYGICLHANYLLKNSKYERYTNLELVAKNYPEIRDFILLPYEISRYPNQLNFIEQFTIKSKLLKFSEPIATDEAFKAYHMNFPAKFYEVCNSYLYGYDDLWEEAELTLYPDVIKLIEPIEEKIEESTRQKNYEDAFLYNNHKLILLKNDAENLKNKMTKALSNIPLYEFNITSAYHVMMDYFNARNYLSHAYKDSSLLYETAAESLGLKGSKLEACDLHIQSAQFVIRYIDNIHAFNVLDEIDFEAEDEWIRLSLNKAAECIEYHDPEKANQLRQKAELGADLNIEDL